MARRGHLHEVELVEEWPEPDGATSGGATVDGVPTGDEGPSAERGRRGRRLALLVGAGLVAALVVGGAVGQVAVDRRERATIAAVAAQPYGVDLLTRPPEPAWQVTTRHRVQLGDLRTADGLLVGVPSVARGPVAVTAVDAATGTEVWRVELLDGSTRPGPGADTSAWADSGRCAPAGSRDGLVTCWVGDGVEVLTDEGSTALPPSVTRVVTLDARDGSVVTDVTGALGEQVVAPSFAAVADIVVVVAPTEGGADVVAVGPDGSERWRTTVAAPDDADERWFHLKAVGELVAVGSPSGLHLLDVQGRTVRSWEPGHGARHVVADVIGGQVHVVTSGDEGRAGTGDEDVRTTVVRPEAHVEVVGYPLLVLDDGSVPGLLLTRVADRVTAWDAAGEELWSRDGRVTWNAFLVAGRLHLVGEGPLVTVDARTGEGLWESRAVAGTPVLDGRHVLGLARFPSAGGRPELVALDPADGTEMWRSPLPDGTDDVTASGHMLVAVDLTDRDDLTLTVLR